MKLLVADRLDEAWRTLPERSRITVHHHVTSVHPRAGRVSWNTDRFNDNTFAAVLLAVGFGLEQQFKNVPWASYWQNDSLHQPSLKGPTRHLVSGCGDGGLIDLLRVRLRNFKHEELAALLTLVPEDVKAELLVIDDEARQSSDPAAVLYRRYNALQLPALDTEIRARLRGDTTAVLNGRDALPFTLGASILGRLLTSRLVLRLGVSYRSGDLTCHPVGDGYEVTFATGKPERFDHVTVRHGPNPSALEEGFPDIWKRGAAMRARNALIRPAGRSTVMPLAPSSHRVALAPSSIEPCP